MSLELYKHYEIIFLYIYPKGPKISTTNITRYIGYSKSTVVYWIQRWKETKNLSTQEKSGRKYITTVKEDNMIIELAKKTTNITAANIQYEMKKRKRDISEYTILRCLHEGEGKYMVKLLKPLLTSIHMKKGLQWAKKYRNF